MKFFNDLSTELMIGPRTDRFPSMSRLPAISDDHVVVDRDFWRLVPEPILKRLETLAQGARSRDQPEAVFLAGELGELRSDLVPIVASTFQGSGWGGCLVVDAPPEVDSEAVVDPDDLLDTLFEFGLEHRFNLVVPLVQLDADLLVSLAGQVVQHDGRPSLLLLDNEAEPVRQSLVALARAIGKPGAVERLAWVDPRRRSIQPFDPRLETLEQWLDHRLNHHQPAIPPVAKSATFAASNERRPVRLDWTPTEPSAPKETQTPTPENGSKPNQDPPRHRASSSRSRSTAEDVARRQTWIQQILWVAGRDHSE